MLHKCRRRLSRQDMGKAGILLTLTSIEKLTSGWRGSRAEVSFAKSKPEVTFTNIFTAIDLSPPVTYNINALLMRRIGQR